MQLWGEHGMVGGVFSHENTQNAFIPLSESMDLTTIKKSVGMMEFLVWDPSSSRRNSLSLASIPIETNWAGPLSTFRGNMYILRLVGDFLSASDGAILGLVCDAHGSHTWLKKLLFGQTEDLPMSEINQIPFFQNLEFVDIPHSLPRLPARLVFYQNEVFWGIPGACSYPAFRCF